MWGRCANDRDVGERCREVGTESSLDETGVRREGMGGLNRGNLLEVVARSSRECGEVGEKAGKIGRRGKGMAKV